MKEKYHIKKLDKLSCSRGHVWLLDGFVVRMYHPYLKEGDRCPMEMSYDRMRGSTYCRRVLKRVDD